MPKTTVKIKDRVMFCLQECFVAIVLLPPNSPCPCFKSLLLKLPLGKIYNLKELASINFVKSFRFFVCVLWLLPLFFNGVSCESPMSIDEGVN